MKVSFQYDTKRRKVKIVSDYFSNIYEHFSVQNAAYHFTKGSKFIPKRFYVITPAGYCDAGFVMTVVEYLRSLNIPFEIEINEEYKALVKSLPYKFTDLKELNCSLKLRPYQRDAVKAALTRGCGTVVVGTGGGKTFIMATLLNNIDFKMGKVLIIVPDIGLVAQTYNDFISYGIPEHMVTKWTGTHEVDLTKNVIIANLGILQSDNSDISWFNQVTCLFIDECHKLRFGNKVNKLVDKIPTFNRFGFTGTLPENPIDTWNITGRLGPVIYEKTTSNLRDEGEGQYIANAHCLAINIEYNNIPNYMSVADTQRYILELDFIHNNTFRTSVIKRIVSTLKNNCLVLVDRIAHGDNLYNSFKDLEGKEVYFIHGDVEVDDRRKIQNLMETQNNIVCIAISKIFSTGISIKNIHYIVFAAGGKSKIKTLQSIGRGLRVHENKSILTLIDIVDQLIYGKRHFVNRKHFYDLEKIQIQTKNITES